jgi:glutathione synthase/RimK-type ligase-like ATP-grasp enzyme
VRLTTPEAVFSPEEIAKLSAFAKAMALDWGGLDILRDRADGRLYVVDVNKTDMGPPLVLSWMDKVRSVRLLAKALGRLIDGVK